MSEDEDESPDMEMLDEQQAQHELGPSVLPAPIANTISLVTKSSALYLRLGTFLGGLALDGARVTTLTGLEISRAGIEGILSRAGRDVSSRSLGELGKKESEGLLERSIATLHSTITHISFAASTGFQISSKALSAGGDLSQQLLTALDSILGSTDSSRAIASIVTLIRREFENPATGQPGEKVGLVDLLVGLCGLALLQRWCKRLTDLELVVKRVEDVVWDVVILDDGRRADVLAGDDNKDLSAASETRVFRSLGDEQDILCQAQAAGPLLGEDLDNEWPEASLKEQIMRDLPANASVSIKTETSTMKTITVEIVGAQPLDIVPPPGVQVVEENAFHESQTPNDEPLSGEDKIALLIPRYRVVYKTFSNILRGADRRLVNGKSIGEGQSASHLQERLPVPTFEKDTDVAASMTPLDSRSRFILSPSSSPDPEERLANKVDSDTTAKVEPPTGLAETSHDDTVSSHAANQKRLRKPMSMSSISGAEHQAMPQGKARPPLAKKLKPDSSDSFKKKGTSIRDALRKGSATTLSNLWNKEAPLQHEKRETSVVNPPSKALASHSRTSPNNRKTTRQPSSTTISHIPVAQKPASHNLAKLNKPLSGPGPAVFPSRDAPRAPQRGNPNYFSSRDLGTMIPKKATRPESRTSHYEVHERRRDSMVSQTETYSIHSGDTRPGSPTAFRTHLRAQSSLLRTRSEKNMPLQAQPPPGISHRRVRSYVPSIYTLNTNPSETSLMLANISGKGAYDDKETLAALARDGYIEGLFPQHHLVRNITRFIRFASASYGSHFLRVMGITSAPGSQKLSIDQDHHYEHHSFSQHTQLPASTILLSSFVDPQGGTDATGQTNTGIPMVHFISLDHDSRAVVLTCRGTLGFEDVLTDMTCDYDDLVLAGTAYKVHKGIHASAVRLLSGAGSRVIATLAAALEEFPDYGLVMCGHSLGGAVAALLAIMISEPASSPSFSFVTTSSLYRPEPQRRLTSQGGIGTAQASDVRLPSGRSIHVYAYGPPATLSPSLRLATRGLITTIINGQDLVPYLSLGVLHDLQAIALAFKTDDTGAKGQVRARVWAGLTSSLTDKWYGNRAATIRDEDDQWAYAALKALRVSMLSQKLVPPGECFVLETTPVLQRDAFVHAQGGSRGLGRPATRAVLTFVRDVEKRFGELQFGGSMLLDHSPGRYESSLAALGKGVLG